VLLYCMLPYYNWNIVECGVKHHNSNPLLHDFMTFLSTFTQGYIILLWNFKFHKSVGIFLYTIQIWLDSIDNFCMHTWLDSISNFCMHTWLDSISNFCIQIWSVFVSNFCIAYKPDQILTVILYTLQTWSESVSNLCIPYKPGQILSVIFVFLTHLVRKNYWQNLTRFVRNTKITQILTRFVRNTKITDRFWPGL
jgi:hypothetical protein